MAHVAPAVDLAAMAPQYRYYAKPTCNAMPGRCIFYAPQRAVDDA